MLTWTEQKITDILLKISDCESKADKIRHAMLLLSDFDPSALFHRIDEEKKGYIEEEDIVAFLK